MYAITGCDTVSHMCEIGKATSLKAITTGDDLENIGDAMSECGDIMVEATACTGACYGYKDKGNMSDC